MAKDNKTKVTLDKLSKKKFRVDQDLGFFGKIGDIIWIYKGYAP